jgi:hypothetical protein
MRTIKKLLWLGLLPWLISGCTTTTITNLTPRDLPRNPSGLYPFQVALDSRQQSLQNDTIRAWVMIGLDAFPMEKTAIVKNRWETLVPVPANQNLVHYRYKFEYEYLSIPNRKSNSATSTPYTLKIAD